MNALLFALMGGLAGSLLALVPALHVTSVAALVYLANLRLEWLSPEQLAMAMLGLVVGYAVLNSIPAVFLTVPDDSTLLVLLPAQKYLRQQRGHEAALLLGAGSLGGMLALLVLIPLAPYGLPPLHRLLQPHLGWILLSVTLFMLLSEWPRGSERGASGWMRFWEAWSGLLAGLATFFLSGLLGFVLFYRDLAPAELAYQDLMPAFVGLFAMPMLLQNLASSARIPPQHVASSLDLRFGYWLRGVAAGTAGGLLGAFFPVVTGGIGALLAGHATAQRDDRLFLVSQGASKVVYYVGAALLFFLPGLHLTRGGVAWMMSTVYSAYTPQTWWLAAGAVALCAALSLLLLLVVARWAARWIGRINLRWLSAGTLLLVLGLVWGFGRWGGLAVMLVASGIGMLPVLWRSRRLNCLGVLLLPLTLNLLGWGAALARWLGLA